MAEQLDQEFHIASCNLLDKNNYWTSTILFFNTNRLFLLQLANETGFYQCKDSGSNKSLIIGSYTFGLSRGLP